MSSDWPILLLSSGLSLKTALYYIQASFNHNPPIHTKGSTIPEKTIIDRSTNPLTAASLTEHRRRCGRVEGRRG
ncbi:MAG: hypothetical protein KDI62_16060 [Anaerolineae bacterium]|nr:hypothetical protein [Anaerolineae bacterium]